MSSRPPSRIGLFLPDLNFGGVERVTFLLAQGFLGRGHAVDLVVADASGSEASRVPDGVRLVDLCASRTMSAIPALARYMRREQPRSVVAAKDHANVAALLARSLAGAHVPVVATAHNRPSDALRNPERRTGHAVLRLLPFAYRRAAAVVAVSEGVADDVRRICAPGTANLHVIRNPVLDHPLHEAVGLPPHEWYEPATRTAPVIVWCGRLSQEKDPCLALEALQILRHTRDSRLVFVGDGEMRGHLGDAVRRRDLGDAVSFVGHVADPRPYVAHADAFVLSSRREGLPTALIEALSLGTRIVSTDCESGPREILHGGQFGSLVPVGDAVALAQALAEALERPAPSIPDGALVEYTVEVAAGHYLDLLHEIGGV